MDRKIEQRRWPATKLFWVSSTILAAIFLFYGLLSGSEKTLNVHPDRITISSVRKASFQEFIPVDGNVLPIKTIYLDAVEAGRVEEKYVEDGAFVKEGDPVLKLSNTDLQLDFLNRETQAFDLINNLQNTRNNLEQNRVNRLNQLADIEFSLKESQRIYSVNEKLFADKAISKQEFEQSKNNFEYYQKKKILIEKALIQDSIIATSQIRQMHEGLSRMKINLEVMKQKTQDLIVKAPASGQISSLDAEVGESKGKGQNLAQLDILNGIKIRANVDEHYVSRIFTGQKAEFEFAGKKYELQIDKIFPQVNEGKFQVDLFFRNGVPEGLKKGQTLQLKIEMSGETQQVQIPRGGFYQETGGNWIYVLSADGKTAKKRTIKTGRQNPDFYEITEGLEEGEKVIVSSYETLGDADKLVITK